MCSFRKIAKAVQISIPCVFVLFLIRCGTPYFSDSFSGALDPSYRIFDQNRIDNYDVVGGNLVITANAFEDLWGGEPLKRGAPLLLHDVPERDYEVECFVASGPDGTPARPNTQVGLFVFNDVENWLFFGFTFHRGIAGPLPDGTGLIITSTIGDASIIVHYEDFETLAGVLLIRKSGNSWQFFINTGRAWRQVGPAVEASLGTHEVGMGSKSFQSGGTSVSGYFDNFIIRN